MGAVAQNQYYAEIAGIPGSWSTVSEVASSRASSKITKGGGPNAPQGTILGKVLHDDLTLTRAFHAEEDFTALAAARQMLVRGSIQTATIYTTDEAGNVLSTETAIGRVTRVSGGSGDADSQAPRVVMFTMTVDSIA